MDLLGEVIGTNDYTIKENKLRIIQESVPGNQVSLAHIIANPDSQICTKLGIENKNNTKKTAIGIMSVTPPEVAIIAGDMATKLSDIQLIDMDRLSGTILINSGLSEVESAFMGICEYLKTTHDFQICNITKT